MMHRLWVALLLPVILPAALVAQDVVARGRMIDTPGNAVSDASVPQTNQQGVLSGTVVDPSDAVIAGAIVLVRNAEGAIQRTTHSDGNGSFTVSGLQPGNYRLVVSNPGFENKEVSVAIPATGALAPLRIVLAIGAVSTTVNVQGREDDLVGIAESAGQITVGASEIEDCPILRSGEILETLPGLIITQHAGGGKANQYFLRGFNLDHGTDFAIFLDGMPLNLPSHAHGEGYADMNTVIPELVERLDAEKGPYYADVGNYGSAGNAHVVFYKTLPQDFVQVEGGQYGFGRLVFGISQKLGSGNLLYGGEAYHDNGPWTHEDNYYKFNGLVTYSQGTDTNGFSLTLHAYDGTRWNSSDQLPYTAIPVVGFFGSLSPTDGGNSQRYSLQGEWHHQGGNSETYLMAYGFFYDLNLFSDFTYYLVDPFKGDQFEQQDRRWVAGLDARHTITSNWFGHKAQNTFGLQVRNDWVHNGLYRTEDRERTSKTYYTAGIDPTTLEQAVLPANTDLNEFTDTLLGFWIENKMQWAERLRSVLAFRGDFDRGDVTSFSNPTNFTYNPNSGTATKFLPSPKGSLIFDPWTNTELYLQGGFSYHSNDVRGAVQTYEPTSPDYPYINTPVPTKTELLVETKGAEVGVRTAAIPHLQSTVELWYLHSNSELMQDGDTGGTSPSVQSSNRYGIEFANYYTPKEHWTFDADLADSRALFTALDPFDATYLTGTSLANAKLCAPNSNCTELIPEGPGTGGAYYQGPGGKYVPEAVGWVVSAGATMHDYKGFTTSLRLRYFGPRKLTSDGLYTSPATALVNLATTYRINKKWSVSGEILNLLNRRDHDIDYAYVSQILPAAELGLTPETPSAEVADAVNAAAAFTRVMHPVEPIQARFWLRYSFNF